MTISEQNSFLKDYLQLKSRKGSLFGCSRKAAKISHADLLLFELIVSKNKVNHIIEFGTYQGITSLYLGTMAKLKGASFISFDYKDFRSARAKELWNKDMEFECVNLLAKQESSLVLERVKRKRSFTFIDNGNKELEVKKYVPLMKRGSIVQIHDWKTEVAPDFVLPILESNGFKPLYLDFCESIESSSRAFKREK